MTKQYLAGEMAARPSEALQRQRQKCALELAGTRNTEAGLERVEWYYETNLNGSISSLTRCSASYYLEQAPL